jgi:hypothetical protein
MLNCFTEHFQFSIEHLFNFTIVHHCTLFLTLTFSFYPLEHCFITFFSTVFKGTVSRDGFGFWTYRLLLPLAGGLYKFYANAGGKRPIQRQPLLVQYKKQANPLLSMHNYTPLVISSNDKNKQLTLLSQRKLALIARNTLFV